MATLQLAYNNSAITQIGCSISGTAMNTGFRVNLPAQFPSFDFFFTGADTVALNGGLYAVTGDVKVTLMDTSGNVLQTATPTLATHVFTVQNVTYFSGLTPTTTYWLRIVYNGPGADILQSDALVQLSGASSTPTVSAVTGYNPAQIYGWSTAYDGVIDIHTMIGMEGQVSIGTVSGAELTLNSGNTTVAAYGYNGGKIRFKGSFTNLYVRQYNVAFNYIHLQSVALNGSSGTPTHLATLQNPEIGTGHGPWELVASGLSSASALYEMVFQANDSGGALICQIMTSGGTGIDQTTTTAGLTRSQFANFIGDSITAQDYPSTYPILCWLMSNELISQNQNKAVLNCGVDGETIATMSSSAARITTVTTGPVPVGGIVIREGINDIKVGSPPTPATLSGYLATAINSIRAKGGGWATVPIWVEGIFPTSAMPSYASINAYNKGAGGYQSMVAQFNAGTAPGQSPASPDLNVHYVDIDGWNLAGPSYVSSSTFNTTNYAGDGLHLNTLGAAIVETQELAYLGAGAPTINSVTVSNTGNLITMVFSTTNPPILPASGATGLTMLVNGVSKSFTINIATNTASIVPTATILQTDVVTFNYTPGNITDSASPTPFALAAFSGQAVTNNSTQLTAPTLAPTVTITGISGGVAVNATTSDGSVYAFDFVQNGGSPVTGTSPQNYTIANLNVAEVFQVRSRNSLGVGPYASITLGGTGGGGGSSSEAIDIITGRLLKISSSGKIAFPLN